MQPTWIEVQAQGIDRVLDQHSGLTVAVWIATGILLLWLLRRAVA